MLGFLLAALLFLLASTATPSRVLILILLLVHFYIRAFFAFQIALFSLHIATMLRIRDRIVIALFLFTTNPRSLGRLLALSRSTMFVIIIVVFLFIGSLNLVKLGLTEMLTLVWDSILSMAFFIQHSSMVRKGFRLRVSNIIPPHYNDAAYAIASSMTLAAAVILWQPTQAMLYQLQGFPALIVRMSFFLALAGVGWGVYSLKSFDPFGSVSIRSHFSKRSLRPQPFAVDGPYRWVRHPLYLFVIVLIWSHPGLTIDRLLFNVLWTAWICIGTIFEERDLVASFGDDYRQYQAKTPMLIPWKGRGVDKAR